MKGREKEKKDGPRQATLFGMMPGANDKTSRTPKSTENTAKSNVPDVQATSVIMSDVEMLASDAATLVETQEDSQETQETQDADVWEETQIIEET